MLTQAASISSKSIWRMKVKKARKTFHPRFFLTPSRSFLASLSLFCFFPSQNCLFYILNYLRFLLIFEGCTKKDVEFFFNNLHSMYCVRKTHTHIESTKWLVGAIATWRAEKWQRRRRRRKYAIQAFGTNDDEGNETLFFSLSSKHRDDDDDADGSGGWWRVYLSHFLQQLNSTCHLVLF